MAVSTESAQRVTAETARLRRATDRDAWDQAIRELGGSILQSWDWGEFKSLHGWSASRLLLTFDGSPAAAAQVLVRPVGPASVLYAPRGPAVTARAPEAMVFLSTAIDQLAREKRAAIAFLEPESHAIADATDAGNLHWRSTEIELQPLRTIKVRVDRADDDILADMKSKTRYNVRLAGRRGVTVRRGAPSDIVAFYELLTETSERDAFGIHSIEYYADMLETFADRAVLLLADFQGELAAGAIILQHHDEAVYMFGASSQKHQRHMPTHLLQFEAMKWARDRGCQYYDLWGIPPTDTPPDEAKHGELNVRDGLWGVYRFKQGFGGEVVSYPGVYERQYYPRLVSLWRRVRPGLGT